jgi:hypothetical protein
MINKIYSLSINELNKFSMKEIAARSLGNRDLRNDLPTHEELFIQQTPSTIPSAIYDTNSQNPWSWER